MRDSIGKTIYFQVPICPWENNLYMTEKAFAPYVFPGIFSDRKGG